MLFVELDIPESSSLSSKRYSLDNNLLFRLLKWSPISYNANIWKCVCVFAHVYVCGCASCARDKNLWRHDLLPNSVLIHQLHWLARGLQGSTCLYLLPSWTRVPCIYNHTCFVVVVPHGLWGSKLRCSCFTKWAIISQSRDLLLLLSSFACGGLSLGAW